MTRRRLLYTAITLAAVVVLVVITVILTATPRPQRDSAASTASPAPAPSTTQATEARDEPVGGVETPAPVAPPTPDDQDSGAEAGTKAPNTEAPSPLLPPPSSLTALFVAPLPPSASAEGRLVDSFPSTVIPVIANSTVVSSSITSEGNRLQVGLTATSALSAPEALAHYQAFYGELGFSSRESDAVPGSTAWVFTRGTDSVAVTTLPIDAGSAYTVFGAFTAG